MKTEPRYEMNAGNLEEAIAMAEASTPGLRWGSCELTEEDSKKMLSRGVGDDIFMAWASDEAGETLSAAVTGNGPTSEANARFFAHARDIVIALGREVIEYRTRHGRLKSPELPGEEPK